jgi:hypothetical protein
METVSKKQFAEQIRIYMSAHGIIDNYCISVDLSHRTTGNYWITTHTKLGNEFIETGIYSKDTNEFLVIGWVDGFYVLSIKQLRMMKRQEIRTKRDGSGKGFLLDEKQLRKYHLFK